MTTASKIADYLLIKSKKEGVPITNKRLQKLLYYIQAWHLAINKKPIFEDRIEAWIHGPAIRSIYEEYKSFVASPIVKEVDPKISDDLGVTNINFIDRIVKAYSIYDTATLEYMTHAEEPWKIARQGIEANESSSNEITQDSMKIYYSNRLANI
ncbi:MAG: type II toxin-antitoxin system antitoxin SocA domain-containing protein [bacterium]